EVMADAGLGDIFLPYNILGKTKLERLLALHRRVTLSVTVDNAETLAGLTDTFADAGHRLQVLVECDTGMGRCGVQSAAEALALARDIDAANGLSFGGLMTFPAPGRPDEAEDWLRGAKHALLHAGLECLRISSGGTPDMWRAAEETVITEYRPGTYIYMDRYQVAHGAATLDDCALTVLATVVSHPTATRAIIDAGSKALSSDTMGLSDFGEVLGMPDATVNGLSEEHGKLLLCGSANLRIGERVRIVPDHCCVVVNLFDQVHLISGEEVVKTLPVAARGLMA
ncbi:MAG TPA: alanine racemase, partial [Mesorhizobium sp.]